jgi:hypothetical protein
VATKSKPRGLNDEQLLSLMALIKDSDSVELKLTLPEEAHRSVITALGLDPLEAEIRQVFFFDTPDLALNEAGLVVRARRAQRKGDDTVVKLRPVVPGDLPDRIRESAAFSVEVDAMPGGFVCSGSMKGVPRKAPVRDVVVQGQQLRKLFSKEQRAFYEEHAPDGIALDDLTTLGPIFVLKLRLYPEAFGRKMVAEMWLYPDGSRVLELSTKCAPSEAFQVAAETRAFLAERGVSSEGEQETKTRKALEFFAAAMQPAAGPNEAEGAAESEE